MDTVKVSSRVTVLLFACIFNEVVSDVGYPKERPAQTFHSNNMGIPSANHIPSSSRYGQKVSMDYVSRYHGPIAMLMVLPDGTLAETPSVAMARSTHLAALEKAKSLWATKTNHGSYGSSNSHPQAAAKTGSTSNQYLPPQSKVPAAVGNNQYFPPQGNSEADLNKPYHGPLAMPMVLPSGFLADTPIIAAARVAHLAALEKAKALWASKPDEGSYRSPSTRPQTTADTGSTSNQYLPPPSPQATGSESGGQYLPPQGSSEADLNKPYHGPLAMPVVLPTGFLVDTSIIAAARAAHLHALLKAQADAAKWKPEDWQAWQ